MTQTIVNLGTGGAVLNGRNGSTGGADSNDALFLDWSGENYVYLPGVAGNYTLVPDAAPLDITGDIDIRVQVALDNWASGATQVFLGKRGSAGRSYQIYVTSSGNLGLITSSNGTTDTHAVSSTVVTGLAAGEIKWVRATRDVNNGASGTDARFFMSNDGVTWTQLGSTITTAGVTSIAATSVTVGLGNNSDGGEVATGKFYRAQIFNGIDGTKVLDVDTSVITTGAATSLTALTGQTVTITRSTSGRKTVAVVSPVWLFGTDDFMEVLNNDFLNFQSDQSLSILAVFRNWSLNTNDAVLFKKGGVDLATQGYGLFTGTARNARLALASSGSGENYTGPVLSAGVLSAVVGVRAAGLVTVSVNNVSTSASTLSGTGSVANTLPMRIGGMSGGGLEAPMELLAVAVFRRALTATEITRITAYYQARLS